VRKPNREVVKAQTMFENVHYKRLSKSHIKNHPEDKYEMITPYKFRWLNGKTITLDLFFRWNGANLVKDLVALASAIHDRICKYPYFDDGTPISNLLASWIYRSILLWHGVKVRSRIRFLATFLFGGKDVKKTVGWI